ncbi:mucin-5AC-like [Anopheles marshallii]|uniref:mucin-5AC-like n=1 Tax=Anopheles marshallii TaxID=1521116 RepID=UPI00237A1220|nr:mucin-5AC-like [Anopheles marshallii]
MIRLKTWTWTLQIGTICLILQGISGQTTPAPAKKAHRLVIMDYEKVGITIAPASAPLRVQTAYSAGFAFSPGFAPQECTNCTNENALTATGLDYNNLTLHGNISQPEYTAVGTSLNKAIILPSVDNTTLLPGLVPGGPVPPSGNSISSVQPTDTNMVPIPIPGVNSAAGFSENKNVQLFGNPESSSTTRASAASTTKRGDKTTRSTSTTTTTVRPRKTKKPKKNKKLRKLNPVETTTTAGEPKNREEKVNQARKSGKKSTTTTSTTPGPKKVKKERKTGTL